MSDNAEAGAATEVAPAETQPTQTEQAPETQETSAPQDLQTAMSGAQDGVPARQRARDAFLKRRREQAAEQPRDEAGRFAATEEAEQGEGVEGDTPDEVEEAQEVEAATEEVAATEEQPEPEAAGAAEEPGAMEDEPQAEAEPEPPQQQELVRIPLEEGHALYRPGHDFIAVPPEYERDVRAAINSYTRRKEVDEARAEARREVQEIREELIRVKAEAQAGTQLREALLRDPNVRARFEAIYEASPDDAEVWLRGLEAAQQPEIRKKIEQEIETERAKAREQDAIRAADSFKADMRAHVRQQFPQFADLSHVWAEDGLLDQAFQNYGAWLMLQEQRGNPVTLDRDAFLSKYLHPVLIGDTHVRARLAEHREKVEASREAALKRQAEAEATAKGKKQEEERLRQAAARHKSKNPAAAIPSQVRTGKQSTSAEDEVDFRGMSSTDIKKHQRRRFLGR